MKSYDVTDKASIISHAQKLLGNSIHSLYPNAVEVTANARGRLGQAVEKYHFEYEPNSEAQPDFAEVGMELKCTPLKQLQDNSLVSKERLVMNIIDYVQEAGKDFETSSFWKKNKDLLLMFYLHDNDKTSYLDFIFKIVREWEFPEIDRKIIRDDWEKIHAKIASSHAHEISEGDTLYLGACTKGSRAGEEMRDQVDPHAEKAQQRAYSLKSSYLNRIILDSLAKNIGCATDFFVSEKQRQIWQSKISKINNDLGSIVKHEFDLSNQTLEQLIESKFSRFFGKTVEEISTELGVEINTKSKAFAYDLCRAVLGVEQKRILEFEKADLQLKTIQLEPNGKTIKESMSFPNIVYTEIVKEETWEDSFWYHTLTKRFLFVVFRKDNSGDRTKSVLKKIQFWTMPTADLKVAGRFWQDTKEKIQNGDFSHFIKMSDNMICHVRPKAQKSTDVMETEGYGVQKKLCYWLNRQYVYNVLIDSLYSN